MVFAKKKDGTSPTFASLGKLKNAIPLRAMKGKSPKVKVEPFALSKTPTLLSWIDTERERRLWSGNTFQQTLNRQAFLSHLNRENLHPFSGLSPEGELVAYGELVGKQGGEGILCRVIVEPNLRRQGYGKAFCTELLRLAFKKFRYLHLTLNAFHFNVPAIRCYKSLGFRQVAFRPKARRFQGEDWDLVILRKVHTLAT
tara:strand:- start:32 stop:628 length:597 start_codon:yes stop_codon:yes gene_type:complete